jgi:hypothetical protein
VLKNILENYEKETRNNEVLCSYMCASVSTLATKIHRMEVYHFIFSTINPQC